MKEKKENMVATFLVSCTHLAVPSETIHHGCSQPAQSCTPLLLEHRRDNMPWLQPLPNQRIHERKETIDDGCNPTREEERQWTGGEGIHSVEWEGEGILAEAKLLPWSDTPDCRGSKNI